MLACCEAPPVHPSLVATWPAPVADSPHAAIAAPAPSAGRRGLRLLSWRTAQLGLVAAAAVTVGVEARPVGHYLRGSALSVRHADLRWLALAVLAELASMAVFAHLQRRMLRVGGTRVAARTMIELYYAANALSVTLPAGTALSSAYLLRRLRSFGASTPAVGFALISSAVLSVCSFAGLALAAGVLTGSGTVSAIAMGGELLAALGVAWLAHRIIVRPAVLNRPADAVLHAVNGLRHQPREQGAPALHEFLGALSNIRVHRRDWGVGLAMAAANWLADLACLLAACRATGVHVSLTLLVVAYLAGQGASSLSFMPGGIGTVEAAMILTLTHGGLPVGVATTAVLLYRLISFALVVGIGWLAWAVDHHVERRSRAHVPSLTGALTLREVGR